MTPMKTIMTYTIQDTDLPITVEQYLLFRGYSKHLIKKLKHGENSILAGKCPVYTTYRLKEGDTLTITMPDSGGSESIEPVYMELDILYEDRDILVINKASNLPIHPSLGNHGNTLANGIAYYLREKGEDCTYRVINRLDRDTTGLLILAKHPLSACILSDMVRERAISRYYVAVANGKVNDSGIIEAPIARTSDSTIERCVDFERGEFARTHYQRLFYNKELDCSLTALRLDTGRTHQIRVHMAHIGHPLPGDFLYNPDYRFIKRQALHSFRLDFLHPIKKEPLHFEAPLPDDMKFIGVTSIEDLWDNDF